MDPRPITHGHLWLAFALPSFTSCKASVFSRLQRAVSVQEIALPFLQRSLRGSVSGRCPIIPLLRISVRKSSIFSAFPAAFTSFQALSPVKVYLQQRVAAPSFQSFSTGTSAFTASPFSRTSPASRFVASCPAWSLSRQKWTVLIFGCRSSIPSIP